MSSSMDVKFELREEQDQISVHNMSQIATTMYSQNNLKQ